MQQSIGTAFVPPPGLYLAAADRSGTAFGGFGPFLPCCAPLSPRPSLLAILVWSLTSVNTELRAEARWM